MIKSESTIVSAYSLDQITNILNDSTYWNYEKLIFSLGDVISVQKGTLEIQLDKENVRCGNKLFTSSETFLRLLNNISVETESILGKTTPIVASMSFFSSQFLSHSIYNEILIYDVGLLESFSKGPTANEFFKYLPEDVKQMHIMNNKITASQKRNFEIIQFACHHSCVSHDWMNVENTLKRLSVSNL